MLGIATVHDHRAGYYLDDLGRELGLVAPGHQGPMGRWMGRSATHLGLHGRIDRTTLQRVLQGCHPATGRPLAPRPRSVVGFDLSFSTPKGVSLLFGFGGAEVVEQVLAAHDHAVEAAIDYVQRRALAVRRAHGTERELLGTDGMVGAGVVHCLSRSGDPHLHTHVLMANLAHGSDGRWSALDGRGLFAHARAAGALFEAHLRAELTERVGARWSAQAGGGFDLEGVDPLLRASFSGRAAEIREHLGSHRGAPRKLNKMAWAITRTSKPTVAREQLLLDWSTRVGIGGGWCVETRGRRDDPDGQFLDEQRFATAIAQASPSGVCRRDVVRAWSESLATGMRADVLDRAVEEWVPAQGALGVAEGRQGPASCVPSGYVLRVLGPRPAHAEGQPLWRRAAAAIEHYRSRWGVTDDRPFRTEAIHRASFPPLRLAEHIEVSRAVQHALIVLGRHGADTLQRDGRTWDRS